VTRPFAYYNTCFLQRSTSRDEIERGLPTPRSGHRRCRTIGGRRSRGDEAIWPFCAFRHQSSHRLALFWGDQGRYVAGDSSRRLATEDDIRQVLRSVQLRAHGVCRVVFDGFQFHQSWCGVRGPDIGLHTHIELDALQSAVLLSLSWSTVVCAQWRSQAVLSTAVRLARREDHCVRSQDLG